MILNKETTMQFVDNFWNQEIIPSLSEYIKIPCKTPALDSEWQQNRYLHQAAELIANWIKKQNLPNSTVEILQLPERTPFIFVDIQGQIDNTVLFYGHFDKMPESEGWSDGLGPWQPVLKDGKLYGRGGVDDGYAAFTPVCAIKALQEQGVPHARCVMMLEATEECGSPDFDSYLELIQPRIGNPDLLICIDAGGDNNQQVWCTTSLRGSVAGNLKVEVLKQALHSGSYSGVVPSSFRVARQLLSRLEDENTGEILLKDFYVDIPEERLKQTQELAEILGDKFYQEIPFAEGTQPMTKDITELLLNKTWRPTLSVIGAEGLPLPQNAGNALRPFTSLQISVRIPPNTDPQKLEQKLKETFETNVPYNAKVSFTPGKNFYGWNAPATASWLSSALTEASLIYFGNNPAYIGEGGSIGVIQMLGEKYPETQFIISGVSTSDTGAHGPNEYLPIPAAKKFTCCVAEILAKHFAEKHV